MINLKLVLPWFSVRIRFVVLFWSSSPSRYNSYFNDPKWNPLSSPILDPFHVIIFYLTISDELSQLFVLSTRIWAVPENEFPKIELDIRKQSTLKLEWWWWWWWENKENVGENKIYTTRSTWKKLKITKSQTSLLPLPLFVTFFGNIVVLAIFFFASEL